MAQTGVEFDGSNDGMKIRGRELREKNVHDREKYVTPIPKSPKKGRPGCGGMGNCESMLVWFEGKRRAYTKNTHITELTMSHRGKNHTR